MHAIIAIGMPTTAAAALTMAAMVLIESPFEPPAFEWEFDPEPDAPSVLLGTKEDEEEEGARLDGCPLTADLG